MDSKNIFVYGTLLNDEVLEYLLSFTPEKLDATLLGYQRVQVKGEVFPAIFPNAECVVQGTMLSGVSSSDVKLLDDYEGQLYQRKSVELLLPEGERVECETYVFKTKYYQYLSDEPWSNKYFRAKYLHQYLNAGA